MEKNTAAMNDIKAKVMADVRRNHSIGATFLSLSVTDAKSPTSTEARMTKSNVRRYRRILALVSTGVPHHSGLSRNPIVPAKVYAVMCSVSGAFVADARSVTSAGRHEGSAKLEISSDHLDNTPAFSPADRIWILTCRNRVDLVSVYLGKSELNSANQHQFLVPMVRHQGFVNMIVDCYEENVVCRAGL